MQFFEATNEALFLLINATPASPPWLVDVAGVLAMDAIWLIPILITGMWVWGDEALRRLAIEACVTTMVGLGIGLLMRHVLPHPRPFVMGLGYALLEHAPVPSFPSDHALVFSAVALTLLAGGRIIVGLLTVLSAIAVGWARVFLGVHFPLDIIGSVIVACAARAVVARHGKEVAMAGYLAGSRNPSSGSATPPRLDPQTSKKSLNIVAAFDFDGTITTTDSLREFVRYTVSNVRLVTGALQAAPWLIGVLLGTCDRGKAKGRFLAATLGAIPESALREAARRYVKGRLPSLVRPEMMARIRQHQRMGHKTILVSASLSLYLEPWARSNGFDAVLATALAFQDGRFVGHLASPNCRGEEKVRRLRDWLGTRQPRTLYAYGDSAGDREMLAFADVAWRRAPHGWTPSEPCMSAVARRNDVDGSTRIRTASRDDPVTCGYSKRK